MFRYQHLSLILLAILAGCRFCGDDARVKFSDAMLDPPSLVSNQIDLTSSDPSITEPESFEAFEMGPLEDFNFAQEANYQRLSLDECIRVALTKSPVVRELGGIILRAPDTIASRNDPALAYVDPRFGEEAALSAFDANWSTQFLYQKNDGLFNNLFIGDEGSFFQDLAKYRNGIQKLAATGAEFQFNHVVEYELNNSPSNRFNGNKTTSFGFDAFLEAGFRQPLLQGSGSLFNRIAGPNNAPGVYNGVLISRGNTDIALAEFEVRVRDLISDVENAYWDLYFAYRDLEAKVEARNGAYDIWRNVEANKGEKSAAIIGQAKEQYYRFAAEVEDAIHGRLTDGTRTNNGSSSGTFRRSGGVRTAERRLRLITGMILNDSMLVVPADQPVDASSIFDWQQARDNALSRRPELRREKWKIKQRELELLASKNHLLPRLDLLGKYRVKGFGHDLFGDGNELIEDGTLEEQLDSSAFGSLMNGNLQEWELGVDMSMPIGFRHAHAAKRHAELNLARQRAVLKEQERQVIYGLSNAMGELTRTTRVRTANLNRLKAANEQFEAIQNIWREQDTTIDLVLEAQRRVIEAKLQYFQTQVEYMLALKAIHFEDGTLFDYHNVVLTESNSSQPAQRYAAKRASALRKAINYWTPGLGLSRNHAANVSTHSVPEDVNGDSQLHVEVPGAPIEWSNISDGNADGLWENGTVEAQVVPVGPLSPNEAIDWPTSQTTEALTTTEKAHDLPHVESPIDEMLPSETRRYREPTLHPQASSNGIPLTQSTTEQAAFENAAMTKRRDANPVPNVDNATFTSESRNQNSAVKAASFEHQHSAAPRKPTRVLLGESNVMIMNDQVAPAKVLAEPRNVSVRFSDAMGPEQRSEWMQPPSPTNPIVQTVGTAAVETPVVQTETSSRPVRASFNDDFSNATSPKTTVGVNIKLSDSVPTNR